MDEVARIEPLQKAQGLIANWIVPLGRVRAGC